MKYKVGMYGGSFDPLHIGHIHDIIKAASMCEELYVMISWCEGRESTSKELRYRWILNSCKHLTNMKIIMVEDEAVSKEVYNTDYYWEKGAQDIKNLIGKPIDIVFCGDDYLGSGRFESLYCPESVVHYFPRKEVPISSTEIRNWAMDNWEYIPQVARPHYVQKVLIVGGESTGKTTLSQNLALAYNTNWVHEVGRDTCEFAGGEDLMIADDMHENLLRQKVNVMDALKQSNRICFVDTDAITTLFYSQFLLGETSDYDGCKALANAIDAISNWDLVLFLEPTVEFVQDGTRNEKIANDRERYSNQIKQLLNEHNIEYVTLGGDYLERFTKAKEIIEEKLHVTTRW